MKVDRGVNRHIQNSSEFVSNYKRNIWNRQIQKQHKTTIYTVYFKPISTYNNQTWATAKRNKSRIQATNMKFLTSIMVRMVKDRIRRRGWG